MATIGSRAASVFAAACAAWAISTPAWSQQGAQPADGGLPEVQVIQKKAPPAKSAPVAKKAAPTSPAPQPPPSEIVEDTPVLENSPYGAANSQGAQARAANGPTSPINPSNILPGNLEQFSSAGTRVDAQQIDEFRPRQTNDILTRVPGVNVINDDGFGRHGGIGLRGSPPRRGRKVLIMEDGQPINMSVWIDPSVHYVPPVDRLDSVEVLRGTVISHGPLNNHGVVNFRNLSPFGPNETEIGASIGFTEDGDKGVSNTRHVHTRQGFDNVGLVLSYSGAEADGTWDLERLRYNDFYSALGFKGTNSDLTISGSFFRQRDNYDEANLEGEDEGEAEEDLFEYGHCKSCFNPGARFNTYNADVARAQIVHNYYVDDTTTITSRLYGFHHRRDRYQNLEGDPSEEDDGLIPAIVYDADDDEYNIYLPEEGVMLGRLRTYRQLGAEVRAELADRPFIAGLRQDIQVGLRYEYNDFTNRNFFGVQGEILEDGDKKGLTVFNTDSDANAFSAFFQSTVHVTQNFNVTPGLRVEHYRVNRLTTASTIEEGEGEELEDSDECDDAIGDDDCIKIEGFDPTRKDESFEKTHVLPGVSFAYTGFHRSTIYGGYHRGVAPGVLREPKAAFPPTAEIGDNFQIGLRSTAIRGVTFDIAAFHHNIDNYQIKGASTDGTGNNHYGTLDNVHINGFEVYGRVDSRPFTGGPFNLFFEGTYTLADSKINKGSVFGCEDDDDCEADDIEEFNVSGNRVPEVYKHFAHLTVGIEHRSGWDASVSWTYRGDFYTDEENTGYGESEEGEDGLVPDVWLLSARANYRIPNTTLSLFVAGDNLLDKLYISDREDGVKPGQGRTIWTGFKYKF